MKNPLIGGLLLIDVLVAPASGCARALRTPHFIGPLLWLGMLHFGIHITCLLLLEPAVRADALLADTLGGPGDAVGMFRATQVGIALVGPLLILLRTGALSLVFDAIAAVGGRGRTGRSLWVWLIGIETVLVLEQLAEVVAFALDRPASLDALPAHQLRAGIGLVYDFASPFLAAVADAASAFTLWWAALLAAGLVRVAGFRIPVAAGLAAACWIAIVGVRILTTLR